jgi:hypothetical protein
MLVNRFRHALGLAAVVVVPTTSTPCVAYAQAAISATSEQEFRAALIADLQVMRDKFLQLAEAFPQDKYSWRPMTGVRSVSEVLMLAAFEGYMFIPNSFGGQRANLGAPQEANALRTLADKPQVIEHIRKGFAHAQQQLETIDAPTLVASRNVFGTQRTAPAIALFVFGDMHEHLGQLIAYARSNQIVPPWSKGS